MNRKEMERKYAIITDVIGKAEEIKDILEEIDYTLDRLEETEDQSYKETLKALNDDLTTQIAILKDRVARL